MALRTRLAAPFRPILEPLARRILRSDLTFSAAGEDKLVLAWLQIACGLDPARLRYLDIGANHPFRLSNTYLLYDRGATGVLVEPDPALCAVLRKTRPRDVVINAGVAFDEQRSARLKRFSSPTFNTFSRQHADKVVDSSLNWRPEQRQQVVDEIDVELIPANDILAAHFADGIDFLSIDTEGVDVPILASIDLKRFRPRMICVELSGDVGSILVPHGYDLAARTPDNVIYRAT